MGRHKRGERENCGLLLLGCCGGGVLVVDLLDLLLLLSGVHRPGDGSISLQAHIIYS